jgi:uncharacterized protein YbbC (DUF1343 family)
MKNFVPVLLILTLFLCCKNIRTDGATNEDSDSNTTEIVDTTIYPGIYQIEDYLNLIDGKNIGIVGNQTSIINGTHLVDTLLNLEQNVVKVFCPEHGFRGNMDAGETFDDSTDPKTGLPIISLYGNNKKPYDEQVQNLDIVIFDLQDVGVRFYTYISTLHYVMESCAENDIPLIVLDRPNPNAHYVDGAILDTANHRSFIGMHPVPVVYGMTIGEYAQMINGEKWLINVIECDLTVIKCENYNHNRKYSLPVKPSPNLPNDRSIQLYPSLCFFESTNLSIGRGTNNQFQIIGHPAFSQVPAADFTFTPKSNEGATNPKLNGELCYGFDLTKGNSIFEWENEKLNIALFKKVFELFPDKDNFFKETNSMELVSGYSDFRFQIKNNISEEDIRASWEPGLTEFKETRKKYLLYE